MPPQAYARGVEIGSSVLCKINNEAMLQMPAIWVSGYHKYRM